MLRRFRDNLANSQKFAKETFMFTVEYKKNENNDNVPNFYKEHPKKIIITITDGMDEELKLTNKWNNLIFNEKDISFGFIFNKPDSLNNEDKEKIIKLWNNFIDDTKKAKSKVVVHILEDMMQNNFYDNLSIFFTNLIYQKQENFVEQKIINIYKPIFVEENIKLKNIKSLSEIPFKNRKIKNKDNQIDMYVQNYPLKSSSEIFINEDNNSFDKNKLGQICKGTMDKSLEKQYEDFIDNFIISNNEIDKMSLERIFKKNKASQKVLSTSGSEIDIISLVISLLNREPRPKIFWEEIGEMKRLYSVSIIIDNSVSCFGDISREHSFQIIRELLSPLLYLDISKLDVILTTNDSPLILCSDVDSQKCLNKDSSFWIGLFQCLQEPYYGCDLSSALNFAYNINKERNEYCKRIFVLTDGLYERSEQIKISKQIQNCTSLDMNIIGIGIGSYPIGIENIFEKIIYTMEPSNLLLGLSGFFEQIHVTTSEKIIGFEYRANPSEIRDTIKKLISNKKKIYFNNLIDELKKIEVNYTTFEYFNKPVILDKYFINLNAAKNPEENENNLILRKKSLLGQKILIVMLWSHRMNESYENANIIPENLFRSKKINVYTEEEEDKKYPPCVESAVDIFGIKIFVVLDYENAIKELTKNENGKCIYNSVWIICGSKNAVLPNPKSNPNLIGEFMKVINMFWMNGGSLVFFADGDPFFYQVNLFLENAEFPLDDDDEESNDNISENSEIKNQINEYDKDNDKNIFNLVDSKNIKFEAYQSVLTERDILEEDEEEEDEEKEEEINRNIIKINNIYEEEEIRKKNSKKKEEKKIKVNFRICGSHKGKKTLLCDKEGKLEENARFNGANNVISNLKRPNIGCNLIKIYEGETISYAQKIEYGIDSLFFRLGLFNDEARSRVNSYFSKEDKNNYIYPFIPFAKDSEGEITIMIYYGRGCGDVVIDCGFTKCFLELETEGTFRYIRNLSAVTSRCDVLMKEGEDPQTWKPDCINYKLDLTKDYFWKDFNRKIYIIDIDKPITMDNKVFIYGEITKEIYSEYNNKIYFYSNGIKEIQLNDIQKENSLIPEKNNQKNMMQIADNLIEEYIKKYGNNFSIMIFTDGFCEDSDNKFMDYILSNNEYFNYNQLYELLLNLNINITEEFALMTLNRIEEIKTYEELLSNYKNIRNSLMFLNNNYKINITKNVREEIKRIKSDISEKLENQEVKKEFERKMNVLLFYSGVIAENVGFNNAAFK